MNSSALHSSLQNPATSKAASSPGTPVLSIVLPVFNELHALAALHAQIAAALLETEQTYEIIFVNDGSTDGSATLLDQLAAQHPEIRVLHLSRNFGHQAAVQAGLTAARGAAIILMDSDLQDDPRALPRFVQQWQQGFQIVYAVRAARKEKLWKRFLFKAFYRALNAVSQVQLPVDAGNFSLIDRQVLHCMNGLPERDRYYPGLRSWVGFRQTGIVVERNARYDHTPRVSLWGLFRLAKTALFSFSHVPLTLFYGVGGLAFLVCCGLGLFALYHKLITGLAIPGWTSMTMVVSLFGAINAFGIAILGEYAIRIYDQVRARPNYLIARITEQSTAAPAHAPFAATPDPTPSPEAELLEWLAENAPITREFPQPLSSHSHS